MHPSLKRDMVQAEGSVRFQEETDSESMRLFEVMLRIVERRLQATYPAADDDSLDLTLTPGQDGEYAFLTVSVNDSWIDEEKVDSIIFGAAAESWVGLERESAGRFKLT